MQNHIKNSMFFFFATFLLLHGFNCLAMQGPGQAGAPDTANQPPVQPPAPAAKPPKVGGRTQRILELEESLKEESKKLSLVEDRFRKKEELLRTQLDTIQGTLKEKDVDFANFIKKLELKEQEVTKTTDTLDQLRQDLQRQVKISERSLEDTRTGVAFAEAKSAQAKEELEEKLAQAQKTHEDLLKQTQTAHQAEVQQLREGRVHITQKVQKAFTGSLPENVTTAEADLFKAKAEKVRYQNSWSKMGVDIVKGTTTQVITPLLVKTVAPAVDETFQNRVYQTKQQERTEKISKNEEIISNLNVEATRRKKDLEDISAKHEAIMLGDRRLSELLTQYKAFCSGEDGEEDDDGGECAHMKKVIALMLKRRVEAAYKEAMGKDYVAPKPAPAPASKPTPTPNKK